MIAWKTSPDPKENHTVLIVSRDVEMVAVWETLFQQKNCGVISESTPDHAVKTAQLLSPSLIVLDLDMPHQERVALCRKLRTTTNGTLLLLAPKASEHEIFEYYEAGVDERLSTPISPMALLVKSMAWLVKQDWLSPSMRTVRYA